MIRIRHEKDGTVRLELNGVEHPMPPKGQDLVIQPKGINWDVRKEYNRSNESL